MARWRGLVEVVSAAALLHDLGHVPVGHTMEDEFKLFRKHDSLGGQRLFEMLYGPRDPNPVTGPTEASPSVEDYFTAIDTSKLPRPEPWQRVPLPWVLEGETYDRFLPDAIEQGTVKVHALENHEIRDLIYLILSFKETVDGETGHVKYKTFEQELVEVEEEASTELNRQSDSEEDKKWAQAKVSRIAFIKALHKYYSRPIDIGRDHDHRPLFHPFMSDAVGNTICADLWDYLVRDGKRLKLDVRDNIRLQRYLVICPASSSAATAQRSNDEEPRRLAINAVHRNGLKRRDTVSDLMDLMGERYRFAEVAYYHPKKAAFSAMIAKAIELLSKSSPAVKNLDKGSIYPAPWAQTEGLPPKPRHVCHFGDESLLTFLAIEAEQWQSKPAAEMIRGIVSRSEYRLIFTLDYEAASAAGGPRKFMDDLREDEDSGRKRMEERLKALVCRTDIQEEVPILLYCPNIRMQAKEVAAHVELTPGKVVPLSLDGEDQQIAEEIGVLNGKYQRLWRLYIFAHPKLVFPADNSPERLSFLSAIIDAFCSDFGVPERSRERGSRYDYFTFGRRVREQLGKWQKSLTAGFDLTDERVALIENFAKDPHFWAAFLPREAPYPVTEKEYRKGFNRALLICAADASSPEQRDKWPPRLKSIRGSSWYLPSPVPNVEDARKSGFDKLGDLAASMESGANAIVNATDWKSFVDLVAAQFGPAGGSPVARPPQQPAAEKPAAESTREGPKARVGWVTTRIRVSFNKRQLDEDVLQQAMAVFAPELDEADPGLYEAFQSELDESIRKPEGRGEGKNQFRTDEKGDTPSVEGLVKSLRTVLNAAKQRTRPDEPGLFPR
jgi:HD superfamily phosphohydrolase